MHLKHLYEIRNHDIAIFTEHTISDTTPFAVEILFSNPGWVTLRSSADLCRYSTLTTALKSL